MVNIVYECHVLMYFFQLGKSISDFHMHTAPSLSHTTEHLWKSCYLVTISVFCVRLFGRYAYVRILVSNFPYIMWPWSVCERVEQRREKYASVCMCYILFVVCGSNPALSNGGNPSSVWCGMAKLRERAQFQWNELMSMNSLSKWPRKAFHFHSAYHIVGWIEMNCEQHTLPSASNHQPSLSLSISLPYTDFLIRIVCAHSIYWAIQKYVENLSILKSINFQLIIGQSLNFASSFAWLIFATARA